jgi:hypothetical protein
MLRLIFILLSFCFMSFGFSQRIPAMTPEQNGIKPISLNGTDQSNILADPFRGQNFNINNRMGDVEGNPLLFTDWKSGEVTLKNNEKYPVEKINLDASRDKFIYYKNDTMFEFFDDIKEIRIFGENHVSNPASDLIFRNDINPAAANFVQVLTKGKITIFQEYNKKPEGENYSNGIVNNTRKYVLHTIQYALVGNKSVPIKFSSSALNDLTSDKKNAVDGYVKEKKLKLKKEDDFLKAISFYNSLNTSAS